MGGLGRSLGHGRPEEDGELGDAGLGQRPGPGLGVLLDVLLALRPAHLAGRALELHADGAGVVLQALSDGEVQQLLDARFLRNGPKRD